MRDPHILVKNRQELKDEMQDKYGYMFCQNPKCQQRCRPECHHIVYRSERPEHPMLHDKKNLILVCYECHRWYHGKKSRRDPIVQQRGLESIFNITTEYGR